MNSNGHHPVRIARGKRKLTLEKLAQRAGVSTGAVCRIETGVIRNPHPLTRKALAEALGYRVIDLWPPPGKRVHPDFRPKRKVRR